MKTTDPQIETYLERLDALLGELPTSERAEIILEIKSHILDSQNETSTTRSVLERLGPAEEVAKKYLSEEQLPHSPFVTDNHGSSVTTHKVSKADHSPQKNSRRGPFVWMAGGLKWMAYGVAGFVAFCFIVIAILVWNFTPIIKVDEKEGRVQILGGLIDVNSHTGTFKYGDEEYPLESLDGFGSVKKVASLEGTHDVATDGIAKLDLTLILGTAYLEPSESNELYYKCNFKNDPLVDFEGETLKMDFSESGPATCNFKIPKNLNLKIATDQSTFKLDELLSNINISGKLSTVQFEPSQKGSYAFNIKNENGSVEGFKESSTGTYQINMDLRLSTVKQKMIERPDEG